MSRTLGSPILDSASASATYGIATLASGIVTVNTTSVKSNSVILISGMGGGTVNRMGVPVANQSEIVAGVSFTIRSVNVVSGLLNIVDNNNVAWLILEPTNNP